MTPSHGLAARKIHCLCRERCIVTDMALGGKIDGVCRVGDRITIAHRCRKLNRVARSGIDVLCDGRENHADPIDLGNHGHVAAGGGGHPPVPNVKGPVHSRKSSRGHVDAEEFYPGAGTGPDSGFVGSGEGIADQPNPQADGAGARLGRDIGTVGGIPAEGVGADVLHNRLGCLPPIDV